MKKTRRAGAFNIDLLSVQLQERFRSLLSVADKRTIFSWDEVPLSTAQVVFFEDRQALPAELPALLALVGAGAELRAASRDAFHLETDFRVTQLADLLDRAAVRLLDLRGTTSAPAATDASSELIMLRRWVVLASPFSSARYMSAMALLTREAATMETLCAHTGLSLEEARSLVAELGRHDAITKVATAPTRAESTISFAEKRPDGLLFKLTRWLTQSRSGQAEGVRG